VLSLSQQIRKAVAAHRAEMAALTKELVRVSTQNPPGENYRACAALLARRMRELGFAARVAKIPAPKHAAAGDARGPALEPRYWVHAAFAGSEKHGGAGDRVLYFHGHYDVVPASRPGQFQPHERKGNIFGRGTADMKGGLAAMLFAARALKDLKIPLGGRIEFVFVPDEETGGQRGTAALFEHKLLNAKAVGMLTAEPTGGVIWNANRGAISMRVKVKGKPAHVGLSFRGVNAFERMLTVARALEKEKRRVSTRLTKFRIEPAAARRSILLLGGRSEGGSIFNVVPAECSFTIDRRINPEENLGAEKKRLLEILDRQRRAGIELEAEIFQEGPSASLAETRPLARALGEAVHLIKGRAPSFEMCPGLLETRYYSARGIPALAYGPGLLSVSHGPNEFVSLREMELCAAVCALTAARLLGKTGKEEFS
jgi:succinyl-diaminopimelate desuccinylase